MSKYRVHVRQAVYWSLVLCALLTFSNCTALDHTDWHHLTSDTSPNGVEIVAIRFVDDRHGWALTGLEFLESTDGGRSWMLRPTADGIGRMFHSFSFTDSSNGWIVGTQITNDKRTALILRTSDGGRTWAEQAAIVPRSRDGAYPERLSDVAFWNESIGWAVGDNLIVHTTDGGQTWTTQESGEKEGVFFGVTSLSAERAIAVGQGGLILSTQDGGTTWKRQSSDTTSTLIHVRTFGENVWAVGTGGTLVKRVAGTEKWESRTLTAAGGEALADIASVNSEGWIVGANGLLLSSQDRGATWHRESGPTSESLFCVFLLNEKIGWAGGSKQTILRLSAR